jgi:hypothetical protein
MSAWTNVAYIPGMWALLSTQMHFYICFIDGCGATGNGHSIDAVFLQAPDRNEVKPAITKLPSRIYFIIV